MDNHLEEKEAAAQTQAKAAWNVEECEKVLSALRYVEELVEEKEGRLLKDYETLEYFVSGYVERTEAEVASLKQQLEIMDKRRKYWKRKYVTNSAKWGKTKKDLKEAVDLIKTLISGRVVPYFDSLDDAKIYSSAADFITRMKTQGEKQ